MSLVRVSRSSKARGLLEPHQDTRHATPTAVITHICFAMRGISASGSVFNAGSNMALIKKLRDQSGAPISDVKKALEETGWDLERAAEELRKKGLSAASKKASRSATEGLVGMASSGRAVAIVEVNSETDFVARNELFTNVVSKAARALLDDCSAKGPGGVGRTVANGAGGVWAIDAEALGAIAVDGENLSEAVQQVAGTVRENIKLRRGVVLMGGGGLSSGKSSVVGTYVHSKITGAPTCGRIAGAVLLGSNSLGGSDAGSDSGVQDVANKLAMHVVGSMPKYLNRDSVPEADLEKERQLLMEQAGTSGKPASIIEKMVEGRLNKFYQEYCLLEQPYVMDDKRKVKDVIRGLGDDVTLEGFVRVAVEGE